MDFFLSIWFGAKNFVLLMLAEILIQFGRDACLKNQTFYLDKLH